MTIKAGEVAFVKTTGEPVYVILFKSNETVHVRRPITGQNGVEHVREDFLLGELESLEEQQARFMAERRKVMDKFGPKSDAPSSEDLGLPFN